MRPNPVAERVRVRHLSNPFSSKGLQECPVQGAECIDVCEWRL